MQWIEVYGLETNIGASETEEGGGNIIAKCPFQIVHMALSNF